MFAQVALGWFISRICLAIMLCILWLRHYLIFGGLLKRRAAVASALLALGLVGGGLAAVATDVPVLVWQRFGPTDRSLLPSKRGIQDASVERTTIGTNKATLIVPASPNGQLVIWFHGHGGNAEDIVSGGQIVGLRDALLDAGYALAASDGAGPAWGNRASVAAYAALDAWASEQTEVTERVLFGQSMGGLASLQMVDDLHARAWIGLYPVCNLDTVAPRFHTAAPAWGLDSWESGKVPSMSPVDLSGTTGVDMMFFHSPRDTVVPKAPNTDACAATAEEAGANVEVVRIFGEHSNQSAYQPAKVLEFLSRDRP